MTDRTYCKGVDVCIGESVRKNPSCPHGPTLLFERYVHKEKLPRRFFACSACRDRKDCEFFQWEDEKVSEAKQQVRALHNQQSQPPYTHAQYNERLKQIMKLAPTECRFCCQCQLLLLKSEWPIHVDHTVRSVSREQLKSPTSILSLDEKNKTKAQYMFSRATLDFFLQTIKSLDVTKVVCIGCPRIHEEILNSNLYGSSVQSLLLDIDHRYEQFYGPKLFSRYNIFNNYFFDGEKAKQRFSQFLRESDNDKVLLVTDPPFGGMVDVLSSVITKIIEVWKTQNKSRGVDQSELPVFWIFPYFMEPRIVGKMPSFTMLDYKIDYDNHCSFKNDRKRRKQGSPIRIFTNLSTESIVLPKKEGYRFCTICRRYVSSENKHCKICQACTSKDGRPYHHCDKCERCVKSSYVHCEVCSHCVLPTHECGKPLTAGCYICGDLSHKKRECPEKNTKSDTRNRKRMSDRTDSGEKCKLVRKSHKKKRLSV